MNSPVENNMRGDLITPSQSPARGSSLTAGAMQAQTRELAELRNQYLMAQEFPRNELACIDSVVRMFSEPRVAEDAQYQYARGGTDISGPSIDAAQTLALCWGNVSHGWRELSRGTDENGKRYSEIEAFAVDLQSRVPARIGPFIVLHWRDTKGGGYPLREERDIYELCANMAQRRKRACLLQVIPKHVIEIGMDQAAVTLKTRADTSPEAMAKMIDSFAQFGVTRAQIEARVQRHIDAIQPAHVVALRRIYKSLVDGIAVAADFFPPIEGEAANDAASDEPVSAADKIKSKIKGTGKKGAAKPAEASTAAANDERQGVGSGGTDERSESPVDAAALRDAVMKAPDRDAAWLVLDGVRGKSGLSPQDHESLVELIEQRFPEE